MPAPAKVVNRICILSDIFYRKKGDFSTRPLLSPGVVLHSDDQGNVLRLVVREQPGSHDCINKLLAIPTEEGVLIDEPLVGPENACYNKGNGLAELHVAKDILEGRVDRCALFCRVIHPNNTLFDQFLGLFPVPVRSAPVVALTVISVGQWCVHNKGEHFITKASHDGVFHVNHQVK